MKPANISRVSRLIKAPREKVYQAFTDPSLVVKWLAPDNMSAEVHTFEAREGGIFRMTLTYLDPGEAAGKTTADKDTFQGKFAELIPNEKVVEIVEFESADPRFAGAMKMTVTLQEQDSGTEVVLLFEDIPPGISPEDNNEGSKQSLNKLARLLEGDKSA